MVKKKKFLWNVIVYLYCCISGCADPDSYQYEKSAKELKFQPKLSTFTSY